MSGLCQRFHTFDKSVSPKARDTQSQKQFGFICRQEKKIANRAHYATAPSHPLEKASDSWWCADLYYTVEVANVDPQLQCRRWSRSPTSIPSSSVDVATITQSGSAAKA